ncbi:hypothetical protein [Nocardioides caldifontis]|uniref:hypothetical protein n=1 Tax=Nocardioides caldifontis TaxID=2588938 RepID=UPI001396C3ED|nr:hypothetical protein [Nocardioides caldifontis]
MTPLHLGELHAYEQALVMVIALGPFAVLGIAVYVVRKRDLAAEQAEQSEQDKETSAD